MVFHCESSAISRSKRNGRGPTEGKWLRTGIVQLHWHLGGVVPCPSVPTRPSLSQCPSVSQRVPVFGTQNVPQDNYDRSFPPVADARVSRSFCAEVVTGSSSSSSTFLYTCLPKIPFHGGMTMVAFPNAFAWQASRRKGFSSSGC